MEYLIRILKLTILVSCIQSVIAPESSKEVKLTFMYVDGRFIPVIQKEPIEDISR